MRVRKGYFKNGQSCQGVNVHGKIDGDSTTQAELHYQLRNICAGYLPMGLFESLMIHRKSSDIAADAPRHMISV